MTYNPKAVASLVALHKAAAGTHKLIVNNDDTYGAQLIQSARPKFTNPLLESIERRNFEVSCAARSLARKGFTGAIGDPLPDLLSSTAYKWIDNNRRAFRELVARS